MRTKSTHFAGLFALALISVAGRSALADEPPAPGLALAAPSTTEPIWESPKPLTVHRSSAMIGGGIGATLAGATGMGFGIAFLAAAYSPRCGLSVTPAPSPCDDAFGFRRPTRDLGIGLIGVGLLSVGAGITLIAVGSSPVPANRITIKPMASIGPASATVGFQF